MQANTLVIATILIFISTPSANAASNRPENSAVTKTDGWQPNYKLAHFELLGVDTWQVAGKGSSQSAMFGYVPEVRFANRLVIGARLDGTLLAKTNGHFFALNADLHPGYMLCPSYGLQFNVPVGIQDWAGVGPVFSMGGGLGIDLPKKMPLIGWFDQATMLFETFKIKSIRTYFAGAGLQKNF